MWHVLIKTLLQRETEYKSCFFHLTNHHVMPLPIHIPSRNGGWSQSVERVQSCNSDSHHHRHVISVSILAAQVFLLPIPCIIAPKYATVIQGRTTHSLKWCWHSWRQSVIGNSILPRVDNCGSATFHEFKWVSESECKPVYPQIQCYVMTLSHAY